MLNPNEKESCSKLIQSCFNFHNRNGRLISGPFEELPAPSKTSYYEKIPNPIALKTVLDRLNQGAYNHLKEVYCDLKLIFSNYSQCVTRSGRDWQDCLRMDQYVDEAWEQKATEKLLPPLEELFPGASHPRLDHSSRKSNPNDPLSTNASRKRSRSQSTAYSSSPEEAPTPNLNPSLLNQPPKSQGKRTRKNTTMAPSHPVEEESTLIVSSKDRVNDAESGWMRDSNSHLNSQALGMFILTRLKNERLPVVNSSSYSIMDPLQGALSDTTIAQDSPALNLELIEARLNHNHYGSLAAFDRDLHSVFAEAEKAYSHNLDRLAGIYVLKRLYQELTQGDGTVALRDSIPVGEAKKLSTVTMGPGNSTQLPRNDDSLKLRAKDKALLEGARLKGDYFRIGDWVHLFNPDNPAKPIVAQIFNTYRRVDTGRRMVSVCWYYRPEETVHYISRTFIVDEIFKTGNFIEHHVEDILGRCLVLFYTKYLRGRPTPPLWSPGMPTYVCEHRYKDDVYSFKKIKNWESCIPSNTRNESSDENFQFFPNAQLVSSLVRVPSPFLSPSNSQFKGSGEPLFATPQEVKKDLPKDQVKYHDLSLSLDQIRKVLGSIPTNPPRKPLKAIQPGEESTSQQSPQFPSTTLSLPQSNSIIPPPISTPAPSLISNPAPSLIAHPAPLSINQPTASSIGHPPIYSSGRPANSSMVLPAASSSGHPATSSIVNPHLLPSLSNHSQPQDINNMSFNVDPFLINLSLNRKPCLVDLLARLDQFEKLPAKVFETLEPTIESQPEAITDNDVREDEENSNAKEDETDKEKKKEEKPGDLIWFPCLPSTCHPSRARSWSASETEDPHVTKKSRSKSVKSVSSCVSSNTSRSLNHSPAYLDWLNKSKIK